MFQNISKNLIKKHDLEIGSFYFYKNFVVSEMNEGISLSFDKAAKLFHLAKEYYGNNIPFVYISNRKNSYSFEPTSHFKSAKMFPNIKGYGVITYNHINDKIASLEQSFLNIPTKIFDSIEDAILWVDELIPHD
ncbi:hypothetical protein [Aquimarina sp. 2201CG14-23]|uniref:hypothetical protein n=1 Tax=Aquimarina mycalae TaxID=3040073 RepID=UPI002477E12B|nr:hypothetical protein [Aquimarina sp. 2201CG14-23]MDH7444409.1 hypothetical protein [Aquimarina sp. 2201CG14-23]